MQLRKHGMTRSQIPIVFASYFIVAMALGPHSFCQPVRELPGARTGVKYELYRGMWNRLPDFTKLAAVETGVLDTITHAPWQNGTGFGLRFTGYIKISRPGRYTFSTASDDGSRLYIDGTLVVDNDGLHRADVEKSGTITLDTGYHPIQVDYFERQGGDVLTVSYAAQGVPKQQIPKSVLFTTFSGKRKAIPARTARRPPLAALPRHSAWRALWPEHVCHLRRGKGHRNTPLDH